MKSSMNRLLMVIFMAIAVIGFLIPEWMAEARGFGYGRYGYGGGSFRGGSYEGARGGQAAWGPRGGAVVQGPEGAAAVRSPYGGAAARGPYGGAAATGPYGAAAVRTPAGNVAAGYRVNAIPAAAVPVVVAGQTYYVADGIYYQQVFEGSEVVYVVVPVPEQ